ncbi:hypothetical protein COL922a_014502, partial [Colletotrichum nupharicola]
KCHGLSQPFQASTDSRQGYDDLRQQHCLRASRRDAQSALPQTRLLALPFAKASGGWCMEQARIPHLPHSAGVGKAAGRTIGMVI